MTAFKQNGDWLPSETVQLVVLANALGVQLNPKETNTQALAGIALAIIVQTPAELAKILARR